MLENPFGAKLVTLTILHVDAYEKAALVSREDSHGLRRDFRKKGLFAKILRYFRTVVLYYRRKLSNSFLNMLKSKASRSSMGYCRTLRMVCCAIMLVFAVLTSNAKAERVDLCSVRRTAADNSNIGFCPYTTRPGETIYLRARYFGGGVVPFPMQVASRFTITGTAVIPSFDIPLGGDETRSFFTNPS